MNIKLNEFQKRTENLRNKMFQEGLDALVIYSDEYRSGNSTYLTGYKPINVIEESPQLVIIVGNNNPVVLMGRLNAYAARDLVWIEDVRGMHQLQKDLPNIFSSLKDKKSKIGVIGQNILPVSIFNSIANTLSKSIFVFCDNLMIDERKIKSPAEINLMGKAAAINDKVLKEVLNKVEIGMTEIQIAGLAEAIARQMGADIASATVVMSGPNTNYPAWRPSERKVEAGDFIMIDFNPAVNHYCNDGGITVLLPGGELEQERALILGHEALKAVIPNIKPNISARVIFDNLLDYLKPHGLEKNFTPYAKGLRGVGHGVGLDVVERPNLSSDSDFNIVSGMTLAIKLDLHGLRGGGYRIEIVVAITENGVKPLNKLILEEPNDFTIIRK